MIATYPDLTSILYAFMCVNLRLTRCLLWTDLKKIKQPTFLNVKPFLFTKLFLLLNLAFLKISTNWNISPTSLYELLYLLNKILWNKKHLSFCISRFVVSCHFFFETYVRHSSHVVSSSCLVQRQDVWKIRSYLSNKLLLS